MSQEDRIDRNQPQNSRKWPKIWRTAELLAIFGHFDAKVPWRPYGTSPGEMEKLSWAWDYEWIQNLYGK